MNTSRKQIHSPSSTPSSSSSLLLLNPKLQRKRHMSFSKRHTNNPCVQSLERSRSIATFFTNASNPVHLRVQQTTNNSRK